MILKKTLAALLALCSLVLAPVTQASPEIEHWATSNGLRVYYVHAPDLPMLDLRLIFDAGSARDGDKPGLASITNSMLDTGADGMSEDRIAEKFDDAGAVFSSGSSMDMGWIGLRTITLEKELKPALDLWLKLLARPDFPQEPFARIQKLMLVGLQAEKQDPSALADKAFYKALYGDHPYGQPQNGTEDSVKAMTLGDVKAFYQKYYVAKNGLLAIVGAVDRQQAEALAEQVAAVLPSGEAAPPIPEVKPLTESRVIKIPYPSAQAHILVGQIGDKRGDEDYFTLYMGNQVLGGSGFNSRLMKEVRDARGLSYSVYSYFGPFKELGVFEVGLQTKREQTQDALKVVRDVIGKFQKEGPTDKELEAAKKDITGGFPLRTASNSQIVEYLGVIAFYNLPLDYLDAFTGKVNALSQKQIADAFTRRVQPDKMVTVIVGEEDPAPEAKQPATDTGASPDAATQGK